MSLRSRLALHAEPVYLMDGSAFIFRSFYAFQNMTRSDGFPTNALYMVARLVLKLLREEKPASFVFVMDGKGPNFRHKRFPEYKAQRSATPEGLVLQLAPLRELLDILGVPVIVSEGCEADDCIATLTWRYRDTRPVVIVGADKDLKQCLHDNVVLWDPAAKDEKITTLADFTQETGLEPSSWPDYQALVGDSSDNIPGIPKIGPKTAGELIRSFPTLEELFDRLAAVPPKMRSKLEGKREDALLYRELTRLKTDSCPTVGDQDIIVRPARMDEALAFMAEYELRSLSREVESMLRVGFLGPVPAGKAAEPRPDARPLLTAPRQNASKQAARGFAAGNASGPQPLPTPPPLDGAGSQQSPQTQAGLFDAPTAPAPEFLRAASLDELPLAAQMRASGETAKALPPCALCVREEGLLVASGDWERIYTGSMRELADFLAAAPAIARKTDDGGGQAPPALVTPDSKLLCSAYPELRILRPDTWFDLSLAGYLLSPEDRTYDWEQVAHRWGPRSGSVFDRHAHPGLLALDLRGFMAEQLQGAGLMDVFTGMELPLVPVLVSMEERGIAVDKAAFAAFLQEVQRDLERLTADIYRHAGKEFNIRSSQQLGDVLFSVLELPKAGKTKGGAASTSQEALEKLRGKHPVLDDILEYRKLEKLRSTYLEPLPALADAENRVHTTLNQTATATGRLSSSNPNLQNIPVRGPLGTRMRGCFTAAPGLCIVSADYSQIELRVLAHLSGDPTLLHAFAENEDIHSRTAGLLYDVDIAQVTPDQRRNAKTINFGLVYGMGAQKLGQELGISLKEAKAFIDRYFERLAKLKEFYQSVEEQARQQGYVCTMTGRRRLIPEILSQNTMQRSQAVRQAINTRIQGSAADIIKLAMLQVEHDPELHALGARLLLQVHDELLLEVPADTADAAGERLALIMSGVQPGSEPLSVPLLVDWGVGRTWAEAH